MKTLADVVKEHQNNILIEAKIEVLEKVLETTSVYQYIKDIRNADDCMWSDGYNVGFITAVEQLITADEYQKLQVILPMVGELNRLRKTLKELHNAQ